MLVIDVIGLKQVVFGFVDVVLLCGLLLGGGDIGDFIWMDYGLLVIVFQGVEYCVVVDVGVVVELFDLVVWVCCLYVVG